MLVLIGILDILDNIISYAILIRGALFAICSRIVEWECILPMHIPPVHG